MNRIDRTHIIELDLNPRTYNALIRGGIRTVEELSELDEDDFKKITNLGKHSVEDIRNKLKEYNKKSHESYVESFNPFLNMEFIKTWEDSTRSKGFSDGVFLTLKLVYKMSRRYDNKINIPTLLDEVREKTGLTFSEYELWQRFDKE